MFWAAVTSPDSDRTIIHVKKQHSPREKPGSTYQTAANGIVWQSYASAMPESDLEGKGFEMIQSTAPFAGYV